MKIADTDDQALSCQQTLTAADSVSHAHPDTNATAGEIANAQPGQEGSIRCFLCIHRCESTIGTQSVPVTAGTGPDPFAQPQKLPPKGIIGLGVGIVNGLISSLVKYFHTSPVPIPVIQWIFGLHILLRMGQYKHTALRFQRVDQLSKSLPAKIRIDEMPL